MLQTLLERRLGLGRRDEIEHIVRNHTAFSVYLIEVSINDSQFPGLSLDEGFFEPFDMVLVPNVVLIEESDVGTVSMIYRKISSRRTAPRWVSEDG